MSSICGVGSAIVIRPCARRIASVPDAVGVQIVNTFKQRFPGKPAPFAAAPHPADVNGSKTFFGGRSLAISANTRHVDAAWQLIRFLNMPDPTFTKYYTNYVQPQKPVLNYDRLPAEIAPGFTAQIRQARTWGPYGLGPVAIPFMWNATGRAAGSVFIGEKSAKEAAGELYDAIAGDALGAAAAEVKSGAPDIALSQVTLLPPITDPDKIICAGRNYRAHAAEAGGAPPENPSVFLRLVNTLVAHNQPMVCPKISGDFDYEGELALIIGKPGRHIAKADALGHIFGYTCFNDGSIRDIQFKHSIAAGKNFHATGGFGPWIVTADEIPDPTRLHLMTRLNGRQVQHTGIDDLIFDIPTLISYCSDWTPLVAGDVISTGTPEGVGFARKPPLWMKPGDVVEVEIDGGVGVLRNPIIAEA